MKLILRNPEALQSVRREIGYTESRLRIQSPEDANALPQLRQRNA